MSEAKPFTLEELQQRFITQIPFNEFLGLRVVGASPGRLVAELPFSAGLVGDADTNAMAEGPITTAIDAVCGSVALTIWHHFRRTATLDLRLDFLRAPGAGLGVTIEADSISLNEHLSIVRGVEHDGDPARPIAIATASFATFPPRATGPDSTPGVAS